MFSFLTDLNESVSGFAEPIKCTGRQTAGACDFYVRRLM